MVITVGRCRFPEEPIIMRKMMGRPCKILKRAAQGEESLTRLPLCLGNRGVGLRKTTRGSLTVPSTNMCLEWLAAGVSMYS